MMDGETFRMTTGDVLHVDKGETYGFHNGGYEEGRLLLIRVPGPATAGSAPTWGRGRTAALTMRHDADDSAA